MTDGHDGVASTSHTTQIEMTAQKQPWADPGYENTVGLPASPCNISWSEMTNVQSMSVHGDAGGKRG